MATNKTQYANVALTDTFETWRTKTNDLLASQSANTITTANTTYGNGLPRAVTTGFAQLFGDFSANQFFANGSIRGGTKARPRELNISTNTFFEGAQIRVKGNSRLQANVNVFGNTVVGNVVMRPAAAGKVNTLHGGNNTVNNVILKSYTETLSNTTIAANPASNTTFTMNLGRSLIHNLTLNANINLNVANAKPGVATSFTLVAIQGSTADRQIWFGGNSTQNFLFTDGNKPTLSSTAGGVDVITFFTFDGGQNIYGSHSILNASANNS
jgi:hypothetical protein